jgi:hypothetical protein
MQDLQGLATTDFDVKSHVTVGKIEIDKTGWNNFVELPDVKSCRISGNLIDEVVLFSAVSFNIVCLNTNDQFSWLDTGATYYNWLRQGRKVRIYLGINISGANYYWKWITGRIDAPKCTDKSGEEICTITGRCFMRMLIENRMKQVYWGAQKFFDTHDSQDEYAMPADCKGVHRAFLDSKDPYDGTNLKEISLNSAWTYDWTTNIFLLLINIVPYYEGTNNLVTYYYQSQVSEEVVADILVESGVLREDERIGWLANADYVTPTGKNIDRVWFSKGTTCLEALRLVAEAVHYRFYFDQDGNPIFKPPPIGSASVKLITVDNITINSRDELVDDVKNHIIVKGEERKKLVKIPTVTTHQAVIDAETESAVMYAVIDSVGKGGVNRRGFQWGVALLAVGDWHESGSFEIGQFEHELTEGELDDFVEEDGCVSPGDINVPYDKIKVSFDIPNGSKIYFSTTEALPAPLVAGTSYYAIRVDSSHIKVALTKDDALEGTEIDITDRGEGVHTLTLSIGHWYRGYVRNSQGTFFGKWIWIEVTF